MRKYVEQLSLSKDVTNKSSSQDTVNLHVTKKMRKALIDTAIT